MSSQIQLFIFIIIIFHKEIEKLHGVEVKLPQVSPEMVAHIPPEPLIPLMVFGG